MGVGDQLSVRPMSYRHKKITRDKNKRAVKTPGSVQRHAIFRRRTGDRQAWRASRWLPVSTIHSWYIGRRCENGQPAVVSPDRDLA